MLDASEMNGGMSRYFSCYCYHQTPEFHVDFSDKICYFYVAFLAKICSKNSKICRHFSCFIAFLLTIFFALWYFDQTFAKKEL